MHFAALGETDLFFFGGACSEPQQNGVVADNPITFSVRGFVMFIGQR
jgi:hypothetical protein